MSFLHPQIVLHAYSQGLFPMAKSRRAHTFFWVDPHKRGVLPLDRFHIPSRLRRFLRSHPWQIRCDYAFEQVIRACAEKTAARNDTWLNEEIIDLHIHLYKAGHAHSIECWNGGDLAGGLYGISLGAVFFGESMFSRQRDASKVALCHLVRNLQEGGYQLLDTQFVNRHLTQFGVIEIPRENYKKMLADAITEHAHFPGLVSPIPITDRHNQSSEDRKSDDPIPKAQVN